MMKKMIVSVLVCLCLVTNVACVASHKHGPSASHGMGSVFTGVAHLVLSPVQIAAGLLEGISAMPYYLSTNIHEINRGMIAAQAKISLDDTYESAYGKRLSEVPENGSTGESFRRMKHATKYFQKVLREYGVPDAEHYILTSIDTANNKGYTLFAVVYRPVDHIQVVDKYDHRTRRQFSRTDRLYYEPFERDAQGQKLDTVIDWAAMPREYIKTQKAQAILFTIAANAVLDKKVSPAYFQVERRWIDGEYREIAEERMRNINRVMDV